jgi:uncharacterized iron-regulated membrane protein
MTTLSTEKAPRRLWLDYVTVWRWHFYAGLFCMPFFCWLAVTGSIYLFRPDIEALLDKPYEALRLEGPRAAPSSEARAAVASVPGSAFHHYEPPATPSGAAQVVVARAGVLHRVYVHPRTLQPLKTVQDDGRIMDVISHLHGELLLGPRGSMLVELAGSWGIVMILTGLYLWLPRDKWQFGGLLYPRIGRSGRPFWRDLHAVAGIWISLVTLFLLLSGLPWSANWGNYLTWARSHWSATQGAPDWTIGGEARSPERSTSTASGTSAGTSGMAEMPGMTAADMAAMSPAAHEEGMAVQDLRPLDRLVPLAVGMRLPRPVWVSPPPQGTRDWSIASKAQNRPLRVTYSVAPDSARVTAAQGFADQNIVDRVVNVSVAAHEGQLFGRANQAILLANAIGVVLITVSGVVMWWRRRPAGMLGAPPRAGRPGVPASLVAAVLVLAVLLPLFGLSLLLVLVAERVLLPGLPAARRWLGLAPRGG